MSQATNPMQNQCWLDLYLDNQYLLWNALLQPLTPFELLFFEVGKFRTHRKSLESDLKKVVETAKRR